MPGIKFAAFTGEQPRIIPRLMAPNAAQVAMNTRVDDGALTPHRIERIAHTFVEMPSGGYDTIYRHKGEWIGFEGEVNAAPGPVADKRLYYTGDGVPKMLAEDGTVYPLALAGPTGALTAAATGATTGDVVTRVYVYTRVTSFGEESEPSPASAELDCYPGQTITLSGFAAAPGGRAVTKQRIYRSQTGTAGTDLYFIAERTASTADFTDDVPVDAFVEPLPSRLFNPPPDNLRGLTVMPNGMMAAFAGKELFFCEPYQPHAWPEVYSLMAHAEIVGLAALGNTLFVMTKGFPEIAIGTHPSSMQMTKSESNLPCINPRSIVDLGFAAAYASHEGLALARADGTVSLVSEAIFNRDDWLALNPAVMVAAQYSGRYIASSSGISVDGVPFAGSVIIDPRGGNPYLIRSDIAAATWFYDIETGGLFFREGESNGVFEFDPPTGARKTQVWRSKEHVLPYDENFGAILIDTVGRLSAAEVSAVNAAHAAVLAANAQLITDDLVGGEINGDAFGALPINGDYLMPIPDLVGNDCTVNVYCDGKLRAAVSRTDKATHLPSGFVGRRWEIEVTGQIRVEQVVMAKTIDELRMLV